MPAYVDGFVLSVPKKKLAAYRKMAALGRKIWRKHGALDYKECVLDDAKPEGIAFTFPKMAKSKPGEVVIFAYVVYKSRAHRDKVNAKVRASMSDDMTMPFDMKRMAFGGFKVIVG